MLGRGTGLYLRSYHHPRNDRLACRYDSRADAASSVQTTEAPLETTQAETTASIPSSTAATTTSVTTVSEAPTPNALTLLSVSDPVKRGREATLTVQGTPNTTYSIAVYYATTASTASGLENKQADASGRVTWTWRVGTRTKAGSHRIEIRGGGELLTVYFTTTE